jgi:iron(III) transport system permease protein
MAATVISVVIAYLLALATVRVDIRLKRLFSVIVTLPMLIPSISHGTGLMILFGSNGIVTNALGLSGSRYIYGAPGIILGSVMYAFPVAFIMLADVLRYEDMSVYEAAKILGIPPMKTFARVSLPYLKKPLLTAAFSTFAMIVTDYGVPLRIGGQEQTLSTLMYNEVIGSGSDNLNRGAVYGLILLVPAILAFVIDLLGKDKGTQAFVKAEGNGSKSFWHRVLAYTVCGVMAVFALLPIAAFLLLSLVENYPNNMTVTWANYAYILEGAGMTNLINSLVMSLFTATVGVAIGFFAAYFTARMKSPLSKVLNLLAISSMAIPGMVLGLSYLMTFSGGILAGTMVILVMVNTAHFLSSPYLMMYNSFGKMNENLEAVGSTLGIGRLRMLGRVFLPRNFGTLAEMFSYLFVNSMMTISAVAFLASDETKPISLLIKDLERSPKQGRVAVVSILILLVNVAIKIIVEGVKAIKLRKNA